MMFLTNTTPTKQARNICLVKRGYRQIELHGCRLCYTWQFLTTCNAIFCKLLSTWVDVVLNFLLQSFECGSHSTLTAATMMLRKCIIIENKVIKFWNALALHYIIYRNHSFTAGKTRLLAFDCDHLYEI